MTICQKGGGCLWISCCWAQHSGNICCNDRTAGAFLFILPFLFKCSSVSFLSNQYSMVNWNVYVLVQLWCLLLLSFNADLDNVNQVLNPWDNVILNLLLDKMSSACPVLRVFARGDDGAPGQKAAMMRMEIRVEQEWHLGVRERERNWIIPFLKFRNGKGKDKTLFQNSGMGRE